VRRQRLPAARNEGHEPEPALLEPPQRLHQVRHTDHRTIEENPCGRGHDDPGHSHAPVTGEEDPTDSEGTRRSQDRSQVAWVLDPVQSENAPAGRGEQTLQRRIREGGRKGYGPLVVRGPRQAVQGSTLGDLHRDASFPRGGLELVLPRSTTKQQPRARVGTPEQLEHRVDPIDDQAGFRTTRRKSASSGCSARTHPLDVPPRVVRIVHRYIFREILVPFALGLSLFTFVLLIARLIKLIELVVNRGVPLVSVLRLLTYILPAFLEVTLPMAMLLAILVAFGRLSADSEMVALRSSGLSLYQLVPPVAVFVMIAMLLTGALSFYARPWGTRSLKGALYEIARTRATAGIKPQVFNDDFPGLVIYTEGVDPTTDRLRHVLVADEREAGQRQTIFAREATMVSDPRLLTVTLRLRQGFIASTDNRGGADYQTDFETYDVNLDLRQAFAAARRDRDPKEMTLPQVRRAIAAKQASGQPYVSELVEYHRKFAIPFACIVFGLVATPLGALPVRAARARGFAVSLVMIFVYYILLSAGQALAEQELVPAVVGLWLPNLLFALLGLYLFTQVAGERTVLKLERLQSAVDMLRSRLRLRTEASS